jgi:hypothetical protein
VTLTGGVRLGRAVALKSPNLLVLAILGSFRSPPLNPSHASFSPHLSFPPCAPLCCLPSTLSLCLRYSLPWDLTFRSRRPMNRPQPLARCHSKTSFQHPVLSPFASPNFRQLVTRSFILSTNSLHSASPPTRLFAPHPSTSQVECHLQVATFASADRCACCRIYGEVSIIVRHRFLFTFVLVLDLLHYFTVFFHLDFG